MKFVTGRLLLKFIEIGSNRRKYRALDMKLSVGFMFLQRHM